MLRAANGKPVEGKMEATTEKRGQGSGREEGGKGAATAAACFLDSLSTYLPCQSCSWDRPPNDVCSSASKYPAASRPTLTRSQIYPSLSLTPPHGLCMCELRLRAAARRAGGRTDDSSVDGRS